MTASNKPSALAVNLPVFASLTTNQRQNLATQTWVQEAAVGTAVLRHRQVLIFSGVPPNIWIIMKKRYGSQLVGLVI